MIKYSVYLVSGLSSTSLWEGLGAAFLFAAFLGAAVEKNKIKVISMPHRGQKQPGSFEEILQKSR